MTKIDFSEPVRIGVIGCGIIADVHVEEILASVPRAEVLVADPLPGKAELLRRKYGLKAAYTSIEEMLQQNVSVVHVLSPPYLHIAHVRQCIAVGAHVIVEKPLCFSEREAQEVYRLAEEAGVEICVDHSLLFQPSVLKMQDALRQQGQPEILQFESFYGMDPDDAGGSPQATHWKQSMPGGALMDSLVHPISLAVGLTGAPEDIMVARTGGHGKEQLRVLWKAGQSLVSVTVCEGGRPFRRTTTIVTGEMTAIVDHSTEVLVTLGRGTGPRSIKKVIGSLSMSSQVATGIASTVWGVARKKVKDNPGARNLIREYYRHLSGTAANPTSKKSVLQTTVALERAAELIDRQSSIDVQPQAMELRNQQPQQAELRTLLLTGASGFLGRNLCEQLLKTGRYKVIAQVRRGANADRLPSHPALVKRYLDFDHADSSAMRGLLAGVDDVVHCAHASGARTWNDYRSRNVEQSIMLFDAAIEAGCKRFIHLSSLAVYGLNLQRGSTLTEETAVADRSSGWDFYIRSKAAADTLLQQRSSRESAPQLLILRPGILYSESGERLLGKSFPVKGGRLFFTLGDASNRLPYVRVDEVAAQIVQALDADPFPTGVFNLAGDQNESYQQFVSARCEALGMTAKFLKIPALPFRLAAGVLETAYRIARKPSPPKVNRYVIDSATRDLVYDTSKAEKQLGWNPTGAVRIHRPGIPH